MDPPRRRSDRLRHIFKECDDVVIGPFLDLQNLGNGKERALSDFCSIAFGDLAEFGHGFASQHLDFEPDLKFALVRPDLAHFWSGITVDHCAKIKSLLRSRKCFMPQKKSLRGTNHRSDLESRLSIFALANAGADETAVLLNAHFPAAKKISHCCDGLFWILRARTDGENQVAQRQLFGFEYLFGLFHDRSNKD